jgi:hypothetical protein
MGSPERSKYLNTSHMAEKDKQEASKRESKLFKMLERVEMQLYFQSRSIR